MKPKAYIFDIDGTLADCSHRLHLLPRGGGGGGIIQSWDAFYAACKDDKPIENVVHICRTLQAHAIPVLLLTGRPHKAGKDTLLWLADNQLWTAPSDLYMRADGDHRPDYIVKREIYEREIKDKYDIIAVFEDRDQCVQMWRGLGMTCLQVANGGY